MSSATSYQFTITATNQSNASVTSPTQYFTTQSAPPVISGNQVILDGIRGIYAKWNTNVGASGTVRLNTSLSNLGVSGDIVFSNPNYWQQQKILFNGLSAGTTYYYTITATSSAGGSATTTPASYTVPPAITISNVNIQFGTFGPNTLTYSWTSSQSGTTAVAFSNTDPTLQVSNGPTGVADSTYGTQHSIATGVNAGTTYYYKVMSTDYSSYGESPIATFTAP